MYKIIRNGRRYNNKCFATYEEARKYVRRKVTEIVGMYFDDYTKFGFKIAK
jgi:hypothetical protein